MTATAIDAVARQALEDLGATPGPDPAAQLQTALAAILDTLAATDVPADLVDLVDRDGEPTPATLAYDELLERATIAAGAAAEIRHTRKKSSLAQSWNRALHAADMEEASRDGEL